MSGKWVFSITGSLYCGPLRLGGLFTEVQLYYRIAVFPPNPKTFPEPRDSSVPSEWGAGACHRNPSLPDTWSVPTMPLRRCAGTPKQVEVGVSGLQGQMFREDQIISKTLVERHPQSRHRARARGTEPRLFLKDVRYRPL